MKGKGGLFALLAAAAALLIAVAGSQAAVRSAHMRPAATPSTPAPGSPGALFGCRAAVAPIFLGSATTPLLNTGVANEQTNPCIDATSTVEPVQLNLAELSLNLGSLGPAGAYTYAEGEAQSQQPPAVSAVANVQAVNLNLGSAGTLTVAGPIQADVSYACVNNTLQSYSQSTLDVINVNGKNQTLPTPGKQTTINLGGGAYIAVNEKIQTPTSLTENILDIHLANGLQVIVGQAEVTANSTTVCNNTAPPNGVVVCTASTGCSPFPLICPNGSTIDDRNGTCVIVLSNGKTIYVSRPFGGPRGPGTVYALSVARKRWHSPCLYGPGPQYVIVVKRVGGHELGTIHSDRILGLGARERLAGLGGNDCIDGQGRTVTIFDGNGNERIFAHAGNNRIGTGMGNSKIYGGSGSDWITVGNGNNRIVGGQASSRIDVGLGHDSVFGGPSTNRIFAGGDNSKVSCGSGKNNILFARKKAAAYGMSHGCKRVILLQ